MAVSLQYFNSPQEFAVDVANHNLPGKLGTIYETASYGGQLIKLVDAGAIAGNVVYHKKYDGSYEVTPTIGNSSRNEVAGVITTTVLVNQVCFVQKRGLANVKSEAAQAFVRGDSVIPFSANNSASKVAAGTAVTHTRMGIAQAVESGGFVSTNLDLPYLPRQLNK